MSLFPNTPFRSNTTSLSLELWREFCIVTGKAKIEKSTNTTNILSSTFEEQNFYRQYYYRNPCVGDEGDFDTINEALSVVPRTPAAKFDVEDESLSFSGIGTIVLLPGVHREKIQISGEQWSEGDTLKSLAIRAAFPSIGAAIIHHESRRVSGRDAPSNIKNQPCITVSTRDDANTLEDVVEKAICVSISHLRILHSTPGADIWGGNTAVLIDGPRAHVKIDNCVLQSDSGRGLVVTNQAQLQMSRSSILHCAATGFYLGDR